MSTRPAKPLVKALGDAGWLKLSAVDPADETSKIDVRSLCILRETLARHDGLADFAFAMQGLGTGCDFAVRQEAEIGMAAADPRRQGLVRLCADRTGVGIGCGQHGDDGGARRRRLCSQRRKDLDFQRRHRRCLHVFARTGEAPGAKGLFGFIVPAGYAGLEIAERLEVIAPHPLARLALQRLPDAGIGDDRRAGRRLPHRHVGARRVPLDRGRGRSRLCPPGAGRKPQRGRRERALFGAPMFDLQMVQGHIADMALDVDAAALLVYRAAWLKDQGAPRVSREAAMAKLYATDHAQEVIDKAVQLHGGDGVRKGHIVEKLYREIRALRIYEGASDVQKVVIARQTLANSKGEPH
jgi:acyl-CoA dehydrogenase